MKKVFIVYLLLAASVGVSQTTDWNTKLKEVQAYDSYTERLTNEDGTWKRPKKDVLNALGVLKDKIQDACTKMGVDPRAVAGAVLAENSLNVSVSDGVQDFLVKYGVAKGGKILGKKFSFGWGQLYMDAAREGEKLAAKLEGRKQLTDPELQDALLVPEKAVYYVAAVIRKVQDDYKAQGIDISKNPALLATLYNLGKSETRARATKASGLAPRVNFFGLFVDRYLGDIEKKVGKPESAKPVVVAVAKSAAKTTVKVPNKVATKPKNVTKTITKIEKPKSLQTIVSSDLVTYQAPPACPDSQNSMNGLIERYKTFSYSKVTQVVKANESYTEVSHSIDCESNAWVLIKSGNQLGWTAQSDLEKVSEKKLIEVQDCKKSVDSKCVKAVKSATKDSWVDKPSAAETSVLYLSPLGANGKGSFQKTDMSCRSQKAAESASASAASWFNSYEGARLAKEALTSSVKSVSPADVAKVQKIYDAKVKEIDRLFKLKGDFESPANPYALSPAIQRIKIQLKTCMERVTHQFNCASDLEKIQKNLTSMEIKSDPSFDEIQNFGNTGGAFAYGGGTVQSLDASDIPRHFTVDQSEILNKEKVLLGLNQCIKNIDSVDGLFPDVVQCANCNQRFSNFYSFSNQRNEVNAAIKEVTRLSDDDYTKVASVFSRYKKTCDEFTSLFLKSDDAGKSKGAKCEEKLFPILDSYNQLKLVNESLAKKMLLSNKGSASNALEYLLQGVLPSYLFQSNPYGDGADSVNSYCPNKTAEYIENLLKDNKCIQSVRMPSKWIINRLNEYSDKLIYQPFEEDDRYAIEFVGGCEK
jgi:hypothetical protein